MPGERSRFEELQHVFNTLLFDEPSQTSSRHPDPWERYHQLLPRILKERTCPNDVVPGLQDRGVVVVLAFVARAEEE